MDARPRHADAQPTAQQHRSSRAPPEASYVSRRLSGAAPGSHLLRGTGGSCEAGASANAGGAAGVRSLAARGGVAGRIYLTSAFFFVLFFFDWQKACRRAERFAKIVDGQ